MYILSIIDFFGLCFKGPNFLIFFCQNPCAIKGSVFDLLDNSRFLLLTIYPCLFLTKSFFSSTRVLNAFCENFSFDQYSSYYYNNFFKICVQYLDKFVVLKKLVYYFGSNLSNYIIFVKPRFIYQHFILKNKI